MSRTIRVTGKGQIKVKPDITRITISLEGLCRDYGDALRKSSQDTEKLKDLLASFNFERSDLKTLNFSVETEYESYNTDGTYRRRFVGYKFNHLMKVEFLSDNELLGRILYALAKSPIKPEFRLSYTVSDPEAAKNKLLCKAIIDAQEKAAVLTQAAGVKLNDIQTIDYSWGQINFEVMPMAQMAMAAPVDEKASCYDMDIEPDDIEVTDTVTVVWEIG